MTAPTSPRIGSMCSGYGGLDIAVQATLGGSVAWFAEVDPDASRVLTHHWPDVPNLGDLTAVDWSAVDPVDVVCAGFPCQDISYAGRGEGIQEGNRSGLWHEIADALSALRPELVVLENVRAIVVRRPGLDVVLADLARLGFDAVWRCVRASDVNAAHQRNRWFLAARHTNRVAWTEGRPLHRGSGTVDEPRTVERTLRPNRTPAPADTERQRRGERTQPPARRSGTWDGSAGGDPLPADATSDGRDERRTEPARLVGGPDAALSRTTWGAYEPAVRRWEHATGRTAPPPTEPGRTGPRLSPAFVEWLMGLPAGHVTAVPGISRNAMLRILGNGVVPQQAAAALALLLNDMEVAA